MSLYKGTQLIAGGGSGGGSEEDNLSITKNSNYKIQTVGVIDQNDSTSAIKIWTGALADLPSTKDPATLYNITDDVDGGESVYTKTEVDTALANKVNVGVSYTKAESDGLLTTMLRTLYPVGSVYIGTQASCPLASLIPGSSWSLVAQDRSLQGSSGSHAAGSTIAAGLPNITGQFALGNNSGNNHWADQVLFRDNGAISSPAPTTYKDGTKILFDASKVNSIYGNSSTVQPPAYVVNIWKRTA